MQQYSAQRARTLLSIVLLVLTGLCNALRATPNSPCSSLCIDNPALNSSDPSSFNTFETELNCADADYNTTAAGQKFEQCITCLQTSSSSDQGSSDQDAFFYNLRATLAACLYGFPKVINTTNSPCNINYGCAPLQVAIETGINSTNGTQYSYCDADNGAFSGQNYGPCRSCLHSSSDQTYLGNFLTALEAGCQQRPPQGQVVGLVGSLFNSTWVNITAPATPQATPQAQSTGLSTGAIIGIVFAALLLGAGVPALCIMRCRKRRAEKSEEINNIESKLDERYGAQDISFPTTSRYDNRSAKDRVMTSLSPVAVPASTYQGNSAGSYHTPQWAAQTKHYPSPNGGIRSYYVPGAGAQGTKNSAYISNQPARTGMSQSPQSQSEKASEVDETEEARGLWSPYTPLVPKRKSIMKPLPRLKKR